MGAMTHTTHCAPSPVPWLARQARAAWPLLMFCAWGVGVAWPAADAQAQSPAEPAPGMVASPDGSFVVDERMRLAWARCVEGMEWNGKTCTGTPLLLDRAQARARANERWKAEGMDWRLPRAPELQHLVNKAAQPPGVDAALFPATPPEWHWTSTTDVKAGQANQYTYSNTMQNRSGQGEGQMSYLHGWAVHMRTGEARKDVGKDSKLLVRLVRTWVAP